MPLLPRLSSLWHNLFHKSRTEQELAEEIDAYLEILVEQKINEVLDPAEARRAALIELGGGEQVKEKVREASAGYHLETLLRDLRYALRMLRRNPGFAAVAVLTLGLGIGANTSIFSLIDAVLLKMLPVKNPEQLVLLKYSDGSGTHTPFHYGAYKQFRGQNQVFSSVLAYYPLRLTVSVDGQPEPAVAGQLVSGNYYSALGVNAALGRTIVPNNDRAPGESPVCVISYNYWRRRFAGDPSVVGKTIHIGGSPFTVIGVTQPEFFGLEVGSSLDISIPIMMQQQVMPGVGSFVDETIGYFGYFRVMGRLRPGVTISQAQASLSALYQQICAEVASRMGGAKKGGAQKNWLERRLVFESGGQGLSELRRQFSRPLLALMIVVALTLLVACANVAGLLLARAVARRKEIAIRLALGAGRLRLVRQLLTESVLLSGIGGLLGLLFASWGTSLLLPLLSQGEIPAHLNLSLDVRALLFTAAVAMLTGALFGLAPAFLATRVDLNFALKNDASGLAAGIGSHGASMTFGKLFVVSQVALSLLLLIGAGLFVRSLRNLQQVDAGFARENVMVMKLEPVGSENKTPQLAARYDELIRRVEALPGVRQASLVGYSPLSRREWSVMGQNPETNAPMSVQGYTPQPGEEMTIPFMQVYPNSFATLGIPLVAGRDFGPQDSRQWIPSIVCPPSPVKQVGIINESMARRFYGNESPIGRRFGFATPTGFCFGAGGQYIGGPGEIEIIGVVKDVKYASLRSEGRAMFYLPFYQAKVNQGQMTPVVRTAGDPIGGTTVAAAVRREARAMDPTMPMFFSFQAVSAQQTKETTEKNPPLTFEELRKVVQEIDKRALAVRERGNVLTLLDAFRSWEAEYAARGVAARSAIAVRILTVAPEVGNYAEALRYADLAYGTTAMGRLATADELEGYKPVDALEALARAAAGVQVVMINEAHHVPQHRAFTLALLKKLRRSGFTHFATETLYETDTGLNARGYPTAQSGYYTGEPVYAELIRTALKLGFRVVAYDVQGVKNSDERERGQARNLIERILKDTPQAKILIHAGYAHIDESGADRVGAATMAQRFKEATVIDPFTIEQTEMSEHSAREFEHPLYRDVVARGLVSRPTVFRNARGEFWAQEKGRHDVTLFQPRSRPLNSEAGGRPDWLRLGGSRGPYRLPKQICGAAPRCLVRARSAREGADAIPIDQLEVLAERPAPALMLPAGEFIIEVQDSEGKPLTNFRVRK